MSTIFNCPVGLSDHTMGVGVSVVSIALGACVIEKHFTLSRSEGGIHSAFSMEPNEFRLLRTEADRAWVSLGHVSFGTTVDDASSSKHRRSIFIVRDMKKGDSISFNDLRIVRPHWTCSQIF